MRNDTQQKMAPNLSPFQYVLCAETSPAVKQQDETLTYINQGSYLSLLRNAHYTEHQQYSPLCGCRQASCPLNTVKFLWDPVKNASVFIQVNCISTELTPRKHGGEKGVPFRIQIDTFTPNKHGEYLEHTCHSLSQDHLIKVFLPLLFQCSFWPDAPNLSSTNCTPFPAYHSSPTSCSFTDGDCRYFVNVVGADLLKMSREDLIQICGLADGIQLLKNVPVTDQQNGKTLHLHVFHALFKCIPRLTLGALPEKSSLLYNVTPQQISHVYRQGPTGIHMLVSDEMVQNFTEETRFVIRTLKGNIFPSLKCTEPYVDMQFLYLLDL
uniref:Transcription factor CP2-like 1 n=1 Tax=Salmo trutta TaxID=8032 RepID=A0A674BRT5_SALTR